MSAPVSAAASTAAGTAASAVAPVLRVRAVAIGFAARLLRVVTDFELAPGQVLAVLGANAAGKSTLLRTLAGLLAPVAGAIEIDGLPIATLGRAALARRVAFLPQAQTPASLTVLEAVLLGRAPHIAAFARPGVQDRLRAQQALDEVGLGHRAQVLLETLSGGERQLAGVARVLTQGAGLALLDEPTTGLDFGNQSVVLERITDLRARGLAVVFSTHDPRHAAACADRVLMLDRDGACELVAVAAALDAVRLERVYGVRVRL